MDIALKQRLIGAIILVALAVIFLPLLVNGPAPDSGVVDVQLKAPSPPDNAKFETRELPLPASASNTAGIGNAALQPLPNPVQGIPNIAGTRSTLPAAAAAGNYAVNFGAYSSAIDANKVIMRLAQAQLPGFSEKTQINGTPAWLVRIGPYTEQAQAEAVRLEAIKIRNDVNARVVILDAKLESPIAKSSAQNIPLRPKSSSTPQTETAKTPVKQVTSKSELTRALGTTMTASKPTPSQSKAPVKPVVTPNVPAASSIGFAVQLGAFGRLEDANVLCDRVRAAGFNAFVEQVNTDKGALHRVRVGPVAKREAAYQLKAQVAAKIGVIGMVRSHP
ncbi:MAG TPA: SPOR domain-containing protein [Xylella sp.]